MIQAWTSSDPWPGDAGALLLVGPPGTGKTRAVLDAYVWPALDRGERVLATSYTRAAALELRERTAQRYGGDPAQWREQLTTIHSEAARRVRHRKFTFGGRAAAPEKATDEEHEEEIGAEDWLARIDEDAGREALRAWDLTRQLWPRDIGRPPRERLARLLSGDRLDAAEAEVREDLAGRMRDGILVRPDFTGLLEEALTCGESSDLDLVAIDEAQDLTPLQWAVADRWTARARRVLVVGDPDQAIYGWAGADGQRLLSWLRAGRAARRLTRSWRVPRTVHALARRVILQVSDREDAPYEPAERDGAVEYVGDYQAVRALADGQQEAGRTALVLARLRAGLQPVLDGLCEDSVPHIAERLHGPLGHDPTHRPSRALRAARAYAAWTWHMRPAAAADARAGIEALRVRGAGLLWRPGVRGAKTEILAACRAGLPVGADVLVDAGLAVEALAQAWAEPEPATWRDLVLASQLDSDDLLLVRGWLALYGDALPETAGRLRLTTAHGSKGREADLVVVDARTRMGLHARQGSIDVRSDSERRDEDLRVLYVALTRTRDRLLLVRGERDWLGLHGV